MVAATARKLAPPTNPINAPIPEIAVEATRLGLEAVARKDWPEAIRHFREAQAAAPTDPAVLFRLALAHDRAAHRLPAIACYRAFQAIAPNATRQVAGARR